MKDCGVNRLSIGLQAVQNHHLEYIGRIHTFEEFEKNYFQAKEVGFENINIDLMYALPNQNEEDWKETLGKIVELNPAHISAYSLILEENTELFDMYNRNEFKLLDEDIDIVMYEYTINYLKSFIIFNLLKVNVPGLHSIVISAFFLILKLVFILSNKTSISLSLNILGVPPPINIVSISFSSISFL